MTSPLFSTQCVLALNHGLAVDIAWGKSSSIGYRLDSVDEMAQYHARTDHVVACVVDDRNLNLAKDVLVVSSGSKCRPMCLLSGGDLTMYAGIDGEHLHGRWRPLKVVYMVVNTREDEARDTLVDC